jgi:hypothetical protein
VRVYVFGVAADGSRLEAVAERLRAEGHQVDLSAPDQLPIADSLAAKISWAERYDVVVAILGRAVTRDAWVEAEIETRSRMPGSARFAVVGGKASHRTDRLETFRRGDLEALVRFVAGGTHTSS